MRLTLAIMAMLVCAALAPVYAGGITGQYVEARTCDVWTGACFANAEMNLAGKHAVLAWKIEHGKGLDGLCVVAVVEATDTLGLQQTGLGKAVILVDKRASASQKEQLVALAKKLAGDLAGRILAVESTDIHFEVGLCETGGCARVDAGVARIETGCLGDQHRVCGHEDNFYPPLSQGVESVRAALVKEHTFQGKAFNKTWKDTQRRGAYLGTFAVSE